MRGGIWLIFAQMLTRYILTIDGNDIIVPDQSVKNWADISCSRKRSDYGGVVRSFISKFEFVGDTALQLLRVYDRDGVYGKVDIMLQSRDNRWKWVNMFRCPLDFSTVNYDGYTFSIAGIDNGLAAAIKANKSTKYEFTIGTGIDTGIAYDINPDKYMNLLRLPMQESVTYEITGGTSNEDDASLRYVTVGHGRLYLGQVNDEICLGGAVFAADDQEQESDSYILEGHKGVKVTVKMSISYDAHSIMFTGSTSPQIWRVLVKADGTEVEDYSYRLTLQYWEPVGEFDSFEALVTKYPAATQVRPLCATVGEELYYLKVVNGSYSWVMTELSAAEFFRREVEVTTSPWTLGKGEKMYLKCNFSSIGLVYSSKFVFSWINRGNAFEVDGFSPKIVAQTLLGKIGQTIGVAPQVVISDFDSRIADTVILAAESIRDIENARLYTSFNDFCNWMEAVFGYIYTIEEAPPESQQDEQEPEPPDEYAEALPFAGMISEDELRQYNRNENDDATFDPVVPGSIYFRPGTGSFVYKSGFIFLTKWHDATGYNDASGKGVVGGIYRQTGVDTIFRCEIPAGETLPALILEWEKPTTPVLDSSAPIVRFMHRSELFGTEPTAVIDHVADVKYSVEKSQIFSSIKAGYSKKDYDSINGRDEFNFTNSYTTGCTVNEKTLSLQSPYRADCYGIEFTAQKRGADTTDTDSDNEVFFVLVDSDTDRPSLSPVVSGGLSEYLYNGAFSPMACIRANGAYIAMMRQGLKLTFASADGNSDISIAGEKITSDITLGTPFASLGILEFTTSDLSELPDNALITVKTPEAVYIGYILDCDMKYSRPEAAKYKLIVKTIQR